jgi:hypothetical protein
VLIPDFANLVGDSTSKRFNLSTLLRLEGFWLGGFKMHRKSIAACLYVESRPSPVKRTGSVIPVSPGRTSSSGHSVTT